MVKAIKKVAAKISPEKPEVSDYRIPLTELLEAGSHFGHQARRWNPTMSRFIYTSRDGVHIFDLAQTAQCLETACLAAQKMIIEGQSIVLVGTKRQAQSVVRESAKKYGLPYISTRWLGGTISNWGQINKSIEKLTDMKEKKTKGEYAKYTKKENLIFDREIARLERLFGGLVSLRKVPDALFVIDTVREQTAILEAIQAGVKIFAIVDSNSDPKQVDYPIPANDDAVRSIELVTSTFARALGEGMELRAKDQAKIVKQKE